MRTFTDDEAKRVTLAAARAMLRAEVRKGAKCPCCTQYAKVYKRPFPSASASVLLALHKAGVGRYHFLPDLLESKVSSRTAQQGGYGVMSQHWGLIEAMPGERADGSRRNGWWRLTVKGDRFTLGQLQVPKFALLYDGRCMGLEGEPIGIRQALGVRFDYDELMAA